MLRIFTHELYQSDIPCVDRLRSFVFAEQSIQSAFDFHHRFHRLSQINHRKSVKSVVNWLT